MTDSMTKPAKGKAILRIGVNILAHSEIKVGVNNKGPVWKCRTCRHRGRHFRTVVYESTDGREYDVECPRCESTEVDEL